MASAERFLVLSRELARIQKAFGDRAVRLLWETVDAIVTTIFWDARKRVEAVRTSEGYQTQLANLWEDCRFALKRDPDIHEALMGHPDGFELAMRFVGNQLPALLETKLGQSYGLLARRS
jgi:hypothetical protein